MHAAGCLETNPAIDAFSILVLLIAVELGSLRAKVSYPVSGIRSLLAARARQLICAHTSVI
eukprot:879804-Pelagomonas_calceolata.AAC.1